LILGIETSSRLCSLCFWREDTCVFYAEEDIGVGHASAFFALLERAQKTSGLCLKDVTHIAVTRGPGSFTGIRVGLAIAKGFELAGNLDLLGLTCFDVGTTLSPSHLTCFAIDTKRNDFYGALYQGSHCLEMGIWTREDVFERLKTPDVLLMTDRVEMFPEVSLKNLRLTAQDVARSAAHFLKSDPKIFSKDPFYMRPAKVYE